MTEVTTQGLIEQINSNTIVSMRLRQEITDKKRALEQSELYAQIQELEGKLSESTKKDTELRDIAKNKLIDAGLKKFEALDGTIVQLNKKPGALIIEDETKVPKEYVKEKLVTSIDKMQLKKDISEGLIIEGVSISEDYTLVIKQGD